MKVRYRWRLRKATHCDDLAELVWVISTSPALIDRFDAFLNAVRPESGWREEVGFDPTKPTVRNRPYGDAYYAYYN